MSEQKRVRRGKSCLKFSRTEENDRISRLGGVQNIGVEHDVTNTVNRIHAYEIGQAPSEPQMMRGDVRRQRARGETLACHNTTVASASAQKCFGSDL